VAKKSGRASASKAVAIKTSAARNPSNKSKLAKSAHNPARILAFYRDMLMVRRFEEKVGQMYGMGLIGGFCHLYIGQEAVVVGLQATIQPEDCVITTYRDHAHMLACGMDPKGVMAELTGRKDGYSRGKGGSMHMFSIEKNFFGGHGIVGANVPLGTGLAFALKYRATKNITLCYFGDGAANQGQVYESFNMAELWRLPVIYVIENNQYAMGTAIARSSSTIELFRRGESFAIPGAAVDGMDVMAVYEAGKKAVEFVRAGKGPFILEMNTYRYRGHSMSDPAKYRTKEEVAKMRAEHDPIDRLRDLILRLKIANEDELTAFDRLARQSSVEAADFAQAAPEPDPAELYTDVLVEG
jgi:pyruvate dehydrogenase E1 component alpha subunit